MYWFLDRWAKKEDYNFPECRTQFKQQLEFWWKTMSVDLTRDWEAKTQVVTIHTPLKKVIGMVQQLAREFKLFLEI